MSVQIITSRHTVNRLSDFRLDMVLEKDGVLYMPASFVMAFYVGEWSCEDAYVASRLDGQTTNCEISGSVISVYFNSPGFPIGQLKCRVFDRVDNAAFTDGTLDTCTPLALPIEIVATAGDSEVITLYTDGYQPPATGIPKGDLEQSVQDTLDSVANKVDKEAGKGLSTNDYTAAEKQKLGDLPTKAELDESLANAGKVKSVSVNGGAPVQPDAQGNVNINVQAGGLTKDDISVETQGDGTVDINVKDDTYKINLNHTHEGMAKLVKCTEATLPNELADDTIYVQVNDASNPTEIESLYLFGLEFTGGGVPAGTPAITRPSGTTINLGENDGSGVSKTIEIKANSHITGDLTVGLAANSDLSFDTSNLPSGVTYNSGAGTLTIAQATAILGVNITIVYSGSGAAEIDGGLVITGGGAAAKSVAVVVVEKGLPAGYTKLDSISQITNHITTNINAHGTTWEFDAEATTRSMTQMLAGYGEGAGQYGGACVNGKWGLGTTDDLCTSVPNETRSKIILSFASTNATMTIGNETVTREIASSANGALSLFGTGPNRVYDFHGTIYSVKCTAGASFDGVPAERSSDNKQGIYDLANDVFYPLK